MGSSRGSDESAPLQAPPAATEPARSTDMAEGERGSQARRDRFLPEATPSPIAGSEPAGLEPVEIAGGMLGYLRSVVSLIEGRCVHLGEILQMLQRMERQHSFARERRIDYVLRYLSEHPP